MRSRRQGAHGRATMTDDVQLRIAAGAQAKREGRLDVAAEHYAAALSLARSQGHPLLIATSRKRFLGTLLAAGDELRPPVERDDATTATTALAAAAGAWCIRAHAVRPTADAVRVAARWAAASAVASAAARGASPVRVGENR